MKRSRQVRITPNMYVLIEAIRLLMSNDKGFDCSFVDASEKAFELFVEFANFDTKGNKILKEIKKVKLNNLRKFGVTKTVT